jgi:hypothetical protein
MNGMLGIDCISPFQGLVTDYGLAVGADAPTWNIRPLWGRFQYAKLSREGSHTIGWAISHYEIIEKMDEGSMGRQFMTE